MSIQGVGPKLRPTAAWKSWGEANRSLIPLPFEGWSRLLAQQGEPVAVLRAVGDEMRVANLSARVVFERRAVEAADEAPRRGHHRRRGRRVPLAGRSEARIYVRCPFRDHAQLQGTAHGNEFVGSDAIQECGQ